MSSEQHEVSNRRRSGERREVGAGVAPPAPQNAPGTRGAIRRGAESQSTERASTAGATFAPPPAPGRAR